MATNRCQVVRPQAGSYGARGFVTAYHEWGDGTGLCRFCGMTRLETKLPGPAVPRERWERVLEELARIAGDARADRGSPAASAWVAWRTGAQ